MMRALRKSVLPAILILTLFAATATALSKQGIRPVMSQKNRRTRFSDMIQFPGPTGRTSVYQCSRLDKTQSVTNLQPVVPHKVGSGVGLSSRGGSCPSSTPAIACRHW